MFDTEQNLENFYLNMYKNLMYENSIAILYKNNIAYGWTATENEADKICEKNIQFTWDNYILHKDYINLSELQFMTIWENTTNDSSSN